MQRQMEWNFEIHIYTYILNKLIIKYLIGTEITFIRVSKRAMKICDRGRVSDNVDYASSMTFLFLELLHKSL